MGSTPYVDELVRRVRLDAAGATLDRHANGLCTVVWSERSWPHPIVLLVREQDLAAAVTALGEDCRDALWPDATLDDAGFRLLLVHLHEVRATRATTQPVRITAAGVEWPQGRLPC